MSRPDPEPLEGSDDDLLALVEDVEVPVQAVEAPWFVLVVDDDADVRLVTRLALRGATVDGRPLEMLLAASAREAREVLRQRDDIAVALVDVVLETENAGLDLVRWIRGELGNADTRIIVRTGQPGSAPEALVVADYDIHDYVAKSEATTRRLTSCVAGAVRAWRDQAIIRRQRADLTRSLEAVGRLSEGPGLRAALSEALRQGAALLSPTPAEGWVVQLGSGPGSALELIAALGSAPPWTRVPADPLPGTEPGLPSGLDVDHLPPAEAVDHQDLLLVRLEVDPHHVFLMGWLRSGTDPWERSLLSLYSRSVVLSLRHRQVLERSLEEVTRALEEREVMLREIHHRVKNNLQITSSLLSLHAQATGSQEAKGALLDSWARVRSMALVHQQLYSGENLARVAMDEYVRTLAPLLVASLDPNAELDLDLGPLHLPIDHAVPCALILNELFTNALKHGRSEDGVARLHVAISATSAEARLVVRDRGKGFDGTRPARAGASLGTQLIQSLVRQLKGRLEWSVDGGARCELVFPLR